MPRDSGRRAGLTRERVLSAAREIAAESGLDRLTIRSLADRLGVAPNAVYGWVASKAALLDALVDDAFAGVADQASADEAAATPPDRLNRLLLAMFDAMMARPELAPLFLDRVASPGPNTTAIRNDVTKALSESGIDSDRVAAAIPVLLVHTLGFGSFIGQTHGAKLLDQSRTGDPREVFALGVQWLLDGILRTGTDAP
ncbi:hypothetical protein BJF84_21650 [Rhodococcus sp. CUA-806]|mgnify:CR=1 FL=1|nr:hypothetical protein BJF84_21650 [Rhodococcus sp. CUA-806]